ncbi:MAG: hypothetical protein ACOCQF_03890 [Halanaerobiaceae bacterium]
MAFLNLYKKELRESGFAALILGLLTLAFHFFLYTRITVQNYQLIIGSVLTPFFIFPLFLLVTGYRTFSQEWKDRTIYLLKSLPRRGYTIVIAKFLAALTYLLALIILTTFTTWQIVSRTISDFGSVMPVELTGTSIVNIVFLTLAGYLWFTLFLYFMSQLACLVSRVYDRFRWLVTIIVFYLSGYLSLRIAGLLARLFNWMPAISFQISGIGGSEEFQTIITIGSNSFLSLTLVILVFIVGSGLLLEKVLEV